MHSKSGTNRKLLIEINLERDIYIYKITTGINKLAVKTKGCQNELKTISDVHATTKNISCQIHQNLRNRKHILNSTKNFWEASLVLLISNK